MTITEGELLERAEDAGIPISPAAIKAEASKLLQRSGIRNPSAGEISAARRAAIEGYLLEVKAAS